MSPGAYVMVHRASGKASGNADSFRKAATSLEDIDTSVAAMMAERVGKSAKDVLGMMSAETWLTVDEAIRQRFATGRAGVNASMQSPADLSRFANVPPALAQWKNAVSASSSDRFTVIL